MKANKLLKRSWHRAVERAQGHHQQQPHSEGQAIVEFAFVVTILIFLIIGIMGLAVVFFGWLTVTSAAREGARLFVENKSTTYQQVEDKICSSSFMLGGSPANCASQVDAGELVITIDPTAVPKLENSRVTVTVEYHVPLPTVSAAFFNGGGITFLGPIWVESKSIMWTE